MWPVLTRSALDVNPFLELDRMQRVADEWFPDGWFRQTDAPAINLWTNDEGAILAAEVPGVDPKEVSITVEGDTVSFEGERRVDDLKEGDVVHRRERRYGPFGRVVRLPFEIEADRVTATYEHGVLRITLPRKESSKPRKIAINS